MAVVKPFRAVLPAPGLEKDTAALPYDVYNEEEARAAVAGHPLSFLNIDRPETQFPAGTDSCSTPVYEKARELLERRMADGTFVQDPSPCYYLYALTRNGRTQTGIVGCSSVDDYRNGIIRRHENTRADKEEDRVRHVDTCNAQTGPIFLTYRQTGEMERLIREAQKTPPFFDFTSEDGVRHTGTRIQDPAMVAKLEACARREKMALRIPACWRHVTTRIELQIVPPHERNPHGPSFSASEAGCRGREVTQKKASTMP